MKNCVIEVVRCLDPQKVNKYKEVPLSRRTNTDRQVESAQNITNQLENILQKDTTYYSVALDESIDATDSAQVLYFVRAITEEFDIYEELLALSTFKRRTRGIDVFNNFKGKFCDKGLNITNIVSIYTNSAPSMTGKKEGFVAHLKKNLNQTTLIWFHCILHQQNLCAKSVILDETLKKVMGIVNFIRANAMRHRQFRHMLMLDDEIFRVDFLYHSKMRWLSKGQVLEKILSARKKIINLYCDNNQNCKLSGMNFLQDVAFLCDITSKQNELNASLQGRNKSIYNMWQKILAFRKELFFFQSLFKNSNVFENHFLELTKIIKERKEDTAEPFERYEKDLDLLIMEYNKRF